MSRCAALRIGDEWILYHNPSIGSIRNLRKRGAVILRKVVKRIGNQVHSSWITDNGFSIIEKIDFDI